MDYLFRNRFRHPAKFLSYDMMISHSLAHGYCTPFKPWWPIYYYFLLELSILKITYKATFQRVILKKNSFRKDSQKKISYKTMKLFVFI